MPEFERDFILRQIRQLAQLVARIVAKARAEGRFASGLEEVRTTMEKGPGRDFAMLRRLDPASAALLVHDPEVLTTLAWIAAQEGELVEGAGEAASAQELRRRALALYAECAERFPGEAEACRDAARVLAAKTDLAPLAERHRHWLDAGGEDT